MCLVSALLEWMARGAVCEAWGNLDPAAQDDGDRCPKCGEESDCVAAWMPDTPNGYRIWLEAARHSEDGGMHE